MLDLEMDSNKVFTYYSKFKKVAPRYGLISTHSHEDFDFLKEI